jgi:uncharacterized protein YndB with AHSA1/START domain
MSFEATSITIDAPAQRVWSVMTDVERWPEWTASVTRVERLDTGPFGVGSRARIRQPKLPTTIWTVSDLQPERSFAWTAGASGVTTVAEHEITPGPGGGVTVTLSIRQSGLLSPLLALLASGLTRRYIRMEAEGLKRRAEGSDLTLAA